jgi:hypothetical protein
MVILRTIVCSLVKSLCEIKKLKLFMSSTKYMRHSCNAFFYNRNVLRDSETSIFAIQSYGYVYIVRFLLLK